MKKYLSTILLTTCLATPFAWGNGHGELQDAYNGKASAQPTETWKQEMTAAFAERAVRKRMLATQAESRFSGSLRKAPEQSRVRKTKNPLIDYLERDAARAEFILRLFEGYHEGVKPEFSESTMSMRDSVPRSGFYYALVRQVEELKKEIVSAEEALSQASQPVAAQSDAKLADGEISDEAQAASGPSMDVSALEEDIVAKKEKLKLAEMSKDFYALMKYITHYNLKLALEDPESMSSDDLSREVIPHVYGPLIEGMLERAKSEGVSLGWETAMHKVVEECPFALCGALADHNSYIKGGAHSQADGQKVIKNLQRRFNKLEPCPADTKQSYGSDSIFGTMDLSEYRLDTALHDNAARWRSRISDQDGSLVDVWGLSSILFSSEVEESCHQDILSMANILECAKGHPTATPGNSIWKQALVNLETCYSGILPKRIVPVHSFVKAMSEDRQQFPRAALLDNLSQFDVEGAVWWSRIFDLISLNGMFYALTHDDKGVQISPPPLYPAAYAAHLEDVANPGDQLHLLIARRARSIWESLMDTPELEEDKYGLKAYFFTPPLPSDEDAPEEPLMVGSGKEEA